jgi:imidazoleglycerol-phosphate dehydratase
MAVTGRAGERRNAAARVSVEGRGAATAATGLPVLDHLIGLLAVHASFDVAVEVAADAGIQAAGAAGRALGEALGPAVAAADARRLGAAVAPADEALAQVALEASGRPLLVSNVDLSAAHVGGLGEDLVASFLDELARAAGLTVHIRLIEGRETEHVLDAIFKALGVALAEACRPRR